MTHLENHDVQLFTPQSGSLDWPFLGLSLHFMTLTVWSGILKNILRLSDVFLMSRLGLCFPGQNSTELKHPFEKEMPYQGYMAAR
jgi:hypothetical protein